MTGTQALTAVMRPGKGLVSEEVAAAIVRFVAGGAELANAEVEPSLLSLICRELNDARIAQGRDEISLDLLAGSHASILSNFYERALADQPAAVRRIIEDQLLTASGFRENIAEERLVSDLTAAGAAPDTLAVLVNRRLLRIEERLDVRRVELTHDVLCGVVKSSRDLRHEREKGEATERLLAEQRERELAARRALVRARQVASVCAALAIGALVAAVLAYLSTQRAHRAERLADQTRATAEQARGQAEQLLGYLTDDFARELEGSGRLDVAADLAKREIDYFHALPAVLKGAATTRNGALALVQYARAERTLGDLGAAGAADAEALKLLEQLLQSGDTSEATTIALARATQIRARILANQGDPDALPTAQRAVDLINPVAEAPKASAAALRAQVEVLFFLGYLQAQDQTKNEKSIATLQQSMQLAAQLGGKDLSDIDMAAYYAEGGTWRTAALIAMGRGAEARQVAADAGAIAQQVLVLRPGHRIALHAQEVMQSALTELAMSELRPAEALTLGRQGEATAQTLVTLDPRNTISFNNLAAVRMDLGEASWEAGQPRESLQYYQKAIADMAHAETAGAEFVLNQLFPLSIIAGRQADLGDTAAAETSLRSATKFVAALHKSEAAGSPLPLFGECNLDIGQEAGALWRGDFAASRRIGAEIVTLIQGVTPQGGFQEFYKNACIFYPDRLKGEAEYLAGDYSAAEHSLNEALDARKHWPMSTDDTRREQIEASTMLALALAGERRTAEAQKVIDPIVKYHRELAARNHGDQQQHVELARALYAQALIEPEHRTALLQEASALLDSIPAQMQALRSVRVWRDRVRAAMRAPTTDLVPAAFIRGVG
jgi:tetratricopeptide (TPR) repeat protein